MQHSDDDRRRQNDCRPQHLSRLHFARLGMLQLRDVRRLPVKGWSRLLGGGWDGAGASREGRESGKAGGARKTGHHRAAPSVSGVTRVIAAAASSKVPDANAMV